MSYKMVKPSGIPGNFGEIWKKPTMKLKKFAPLLLCLFLSFSTIAQFDSTQDSPYKTSWKKDGIWLGTSLGLNAVGFVLVQNIEPLTEAQVQALDKDDVPKIDRWLAGRYSKEADDLSYYPFYGSFAVPFIMMLTDDYRGHAGQLSLLFVESMATTGALFTITAGSIHRSRPLTYNEDLPFDQRSEGSSRRSFFAGHTAATASATFFAAKIFNDFNPDSAARPYVWTAAALIPAWVGYLRSKAGKHFLTDNILGYGIGALSGILIPELHKKEDPDFSFYPSYGKEYKGVSLLYRF
ncbi:phosphatase PAP2 family protein [Salinimicrobium soli]|uniref:phosphatase PAP2 family protein n=1 Tax=Salinimicrobium soli TaxID=1254399 RepID=UPI003AAF5BEF